MTRTNKRSYPNVAAGSLAVVFVVLGIACSSSKDTTAKRATDTIATVAPPVAIDCPSDGLWKSCTVMTHLERAGVAPHDDPPDTTRVSFLAQPGIHFRVGKSSTLIAFFFPDSIAAKKAWLALDTMCLTPKSDTALPCVKPPTTVRNANLVAAFYSESERQAERVRLALMAGLPAPERRAKP